MVVTTDKCYENRESPRPYQEDDALGGHDPYSSSKAAAELATSAYRRSFFTPRVGVATARAGNVLGGGDWAEDRLVPDAMRAFARGEPLVLRNPEDTAASARMPETTLDTLIQSTGRVHGAPAPSSPPRPREIEVLRSAGAGATDAPPSE